MSAVEPSCIGWARRRRAGRDPGSASSGGGVPPAGSSWSRAAKPGPIGRNVSLPLARSHWPSPFSPSPEGRLVALPVAGGDVVDDDVARDVVHRRRHRNATRPSADDDPELHLEIEGVRALGPDDRLAVGDDGVGELREEEGPSGTSRPAPSATWSR